MTISGPGGSAAVLVAIAIGSCANGCGEGDKQMGIVRAPTTTVANKHDSVLKVGRAATRAERSTVTALMTRYYSAAASEDGVTACSLLLPSIARSVPEDYGSGAGPSYLQGGKTCQDVMTKLFAHSRKQFVAQATTLTVTAVRILREGGFAIMRFDTNARREMNIVLRDGKWWVGSVLDGKLY